MLRILCTAQCDVCGDFFDRLSADTTANQNSCALMAGGIIEAAGEEGWFFNEKTRQFWCVDCVMAHAGNATLPKVSEITVPQTTFGAEQSRIDCDF
jgi:cytochrome bd-type quinol oxidase subunit 1